MAKKKKTTKPKIEKGYPLPNPKNGRPRKYDLDKMKVGDSMFIPNKTSSTIQSSIRNVTKYRSKWKFSCEREEGVIGGETVKGVRVHRIK